MAIEKGNAVHESQSKPVVPRDIDPSKLKMTLSPSLSPIPPPTSLKFGEQHTDHMLVISYDPKTGWSDPEIKPYGNFEIDPMSSCFQYATNCFEGMKAYLGPNSHPLLFRPTMNMARLTSSVNRLSLPSFSTTAFLSLIKTLVLTEKRWIPRDPAGNALTGYSLYVRPTMIGTKSSLGVGPSDKAILYVICSPTGPFFPLETGLGNVPGYIKPVSLLAVSEHVRAWPGGTGAHKLALNYSPGFLTQKDASEKGYDQILWLRKEGEEEIIMEVGAMNFFVAVKRDDGDIDIITPPLDGTILPGVTRASILELAKSDSSLFSTKLHPSESQLTTAQLKQWSSSGKLLEIFGVGTAAIVAPIALIGFQQGEKITVPEYEQGIGPVASAIRTRILDIQEGRIEWDGWAVPC